MIFTILNWFSPKETIMTDKVLQISAPAPPFSGINETGETITSADYQGKKLIIFFYPADNTPGCTAEACSLRDGFSDLRALGYSLLGVSPDSSKKHQGFIQKYQLPYPLIADTEHKMLKDFGVWGSKKFMGKVYDGVLRTTVIINEDGIVTHIIDKVATKDHAGQILSLVQEA